METRLTPYQAQPLIACSRALVFAPHPDDEALGCGGLLAAYKLAGIPVSAVIVTSGEHGEHGRQGIEVRENESRAAAAQLGIAALSFWREPDRGVAFNERTVAAAMQAITDSGADLILAPSTSEIHPDHRATAWIIIEATRRLVAKRMALRLALFEIGSPLPRVTVLVDITAQEASKRDAVACYSSQLALQRYDEVVLGLNRFRTYTLPTTVKYAEAFHLLTTADLQHPVLLAEPELHRQERLNLVSARSEQEKVCVLIRSMDRPTLSRTLDSIALQTWPNIEVLVLNAKGKGHRPLASTVGTLPLRFIDSDHSVPRAEAANLLLELADSPLAIYLDDDDWFAPDHIAHLVEHLRSRPDVACAFSGVEFGHLVRNDAAGEQWQMQHQFNASYDACRLLFENYLPIHSVLFRVQQIRDNWKCRFDTTLTVFEDWDFWLQIASHGPFSGTGHISAFYTFNVLDGSGVFSAPEANTSRMQELQEKWFVRLSPARYTQLLHYAQARYRELAQSRAQASAQSAQHELELQSAQEAAQFHESQVRVAAQEELRGFQAIISARDDDIANYKIHACELQDMIKTKDADLTQLSTRLQDSHTHAEQLSAVLMARDEEITNLHKALEATNAAVQSSSAELAHVRESLEALRNATNSRRWLLKKLLRRDFPQSE